MQLKKYDFKNLPFSDLFLAYTHNFDAVSGYYQTNPFNAEALKDRAESFDFAGDRKRTASILKTFNRQFDIDKGSPVFKNITRLQQDDALAIVTGQQLGIYGGPLFTIYKTITTIHQAKKLEEELGRPVIPIFWLADEDHDYEEIRSIVLPGDEGPESFSMPPLNGDLPPVSELEYPEKITSLSGSIRDTLVKSDYSDDLWNVLDDCFKPGQRFNEGFGNFIARLFSGHGLVLAGSNHPQVKEQTKGVLTYAVREADAIRNALEEQSQHIGSEFHQQVKLYDSHLFYLDDESGRTKISRNGEQWETEAGQSWGTKDLIDLIDDQPAQFSPDVFLRPILQDALLPTLGYVAGPGEVAYYGQMKTFYHCFDQRMPAIIPRLSATFIEPAIDRIIQNLPFDIKEYNSRIEDLESDYVDRTEETDIETLFNEWQKKISDVSEPFIEQIIAVNETLEGAAAKAQARYKNEREKLQKKVYSAIKKRENIQLSRIQRIQHHLFPGRSLQERTYCGIYYMNKFGLDIWDRLLEQMDEASLDTHTLIYL